MENEYYLEIIYDGEIVYRKESLKPLRMNKISVEVGVVEERNDVTIHERKL